MIKAHMSKTPKRIFIAGHKGMVGSALMRKLQSQKDVTLLTQSRKTLDLTQQKAVFDYFKNNDIHEVYMAAAKVGGIHANISYPAEFLYQNLSIQNNLIEAARRYDIDKLLFLGSSCIYPRHAAQPISESALLSGPLEPSNAPYAIAKIAGIKLCEAYNQQYGCDFRSLMPTNLYGPNDNFHPQNSHVIPALIRKFHNGVTQQRKTVTIWGSGRPRREFLHVDDLASAAIHIMSLDRHLYHIMTQPQQSHINIGTGKDISIKELADLLAEIAGFSGKIIFDETMPDGTPRKCLDITQAQNLGWAPQIALKPGLMQSYNWYKTQCKLLQI